MAELSSIFPFICFGNFRLSGGIAEAVFYDSDWEEGISENDFLIYVFCFPPVYCLQPAFIKQSLGLPLQGQNEANIQGVLLENPYLFLLVGCFIGPVVEELFFRRFFLGTFLAKFSNWISIVLTTFLFATLHMHSWSMSEWVTAISYIAGGFLFSLLYLKKDKNIWYPITLHCCNNIFAFIITLLTIIKWKPRSSRPLGFLLFSLSPHSPFCIQIFSLIKMRSS